MQIEGDSKASGSSNKSNSLSPLAAFPNEVFEAIFTYLSPLELSRLAQSSRSLYQISTSSTLWEHAYFSFWREGDEEREVARGTRKWRERRRYGDLKEAARRAWSADGKLAEQGPSYSKRARIEETSIQTKFTPFPFALSGGPSDDTSSEQSSHRSPHFYQLFLERIRIDDEILQVIKEQCFSSTMWMERVKDVVARYGNDAKDILHALVASQSRNNDEDTDLTASETFEFPTALQVRLPSTKRSRTHHLSLLHYGRELLEHLQCREALFGFVSSRENCHTGPITRHWINIQDQGLEDMNGKALAAAKRSKSFETAISWLSMFRGGEGQEIAEELDVLAVSCSLYLASLGITLEDDVQKFASGICKFMLSRSFKGATPAEYKNLDNNFLHYCLDESGRETLPMSLVIIYCAIASRLGLPALPTNTPARIIVVVETDLINLASSSSNESSSSNGRFWIDIYGDGQILKTEDVQAMLARMRYPMEEVFISHSTPEATCLRASRNIVMSVQGAQSVPRFHVRPVAKLDDEEDDQMLPPHASMGNLRADQVFHQIIMAPNALFHPRRTYLSSSGPQLASPFWSVPPASNNRDVIRGRYQRMTKWSDFDQQAAMHAASNALTRLGDELGDRGSDWCATLIQTYFPLDTLVVQRELVDQSYGSPLYIQNEVTRRSVSTMFQTLIQEDSQGPTVVRRTKEEHSQIYKVGTLFSHRQYSYKAAIVGWNEKCDATEEWMISMGVDDLPNGGRMQPFYQSLVEDGSTRYVAHCNIVPANHQPPSIGLSRRSSSTSTGILSISDAEEVLRQRGVGKFFRCLSVQDGQLRLVRNALGRQAFPDD